MRNTRNMETVKRLITSEDVNTHLLNNYREEVIECLSNYLARHGLRVLQFAEMAQSGEHPTFTHYEEILLADVINELSDF